jgi:nucleoid-associated protein YgaU
MKYLIVLAGIVLLGGCVTRTYSIEKPRTNLEVNGNRGYLIGTPNEPPAPNKFGQTRKFSVLEVELGTHSKNKPVVKKEEPKSVEEASSEQSISEQPVANKEEPAPEKKYESYTIQKDDTLQKISEKFYGTTRKWKMLYDENKDVLKSPDRVYPGKTIRIPKLDK